MLLRGNTLESVKGVIIKRNDRSLQNEYSRENTNNFS